MAITKIQSESLNLADDYAFTGTITGAGESNVPAFKAYRSSDQSLSSGAITKIQFDTEIFDTDSCYDNSTNYRFTPTTAGKYLFLANVRCYGSTGTLRYINLYLRKNGGSSAPNGFGNYLAEDNGNNFNSGGVHHSAIFDMNGSTDYVESYVQCQATNPNIGYSNNGHTTTFMGFKITD